MFVFPFGNLRFLINLLNTWGVVWGSLVNTGGGLSELRGSIHWLACFAKVGPDAKSEGAYAMEEGDTEAVTQYRAEYEGSLRRWTDASMEGRQRKKPRRHIHRKKIFRACLEADNALLLDSRKGPGLKHFQRPPEGSEDPAASLPPLQWPLLIWASDEGPDMWGAFNFLVSQKCRLNLARTPDTNHGVHGDVLRSLVAAGLGSHMYVFCVIVNVSFLPWGDGRYGREMAELMDEHQELWTHEDSPIFLFFMKLLARDKGMTHEVHTDEGVRELWQAVHDSRSLRCLGSKVGMCRFYQLVKELQAFMPDWHSVLLWACLQTCDSMFWDKEAMREMDMRLRRFSAAPEADAAGPTKKSSADNVKALRRMCKNPVELAAVTLMDPMMHARAGAVCFLPQPTHEWYMDQAHRLRSAPAAATWCKQQIGGDLWKPLRGSFAQLRDPVLLEKLDVLLRPSPRHMAAGLGGADVEEQDQIAAMAGKVSTLLVYHRCIRLSWMWSGWPAGVVSFADPEPAVALGAVERLKIHYTAFEATKGLASKYWQDVVKRSMMDHYSVQMFTRTLSELNWVLGEAVVAKADEFAHSCWQSLLVEDGFLRERRAEARAANMSLSEEPLKKEIC